jgi:hypothetical protein
MKERDYDVLAAVRGQRKMSQVLGAFGLLDFTMLRPFPLGGRFESSEPFIYLVLKFFSGRGKPRITETADTESVDTGARMYVEVLINFNFRIKYIV